MMNSFMNLRVAVKNAVSNWGITPEGFINNSKGEWLLLIQLFIIALHALPAWPKIIPNQNWILTTTYAGYILLLLGLVYSIHALISLGPNLSPLPEPKRGAILVTNGAYKNCRHPLYKGLITASIGLTMILTSILHIFILIGLCVVLHIKAKSEEKRLKCIYRDYSLYCNNTPAIIKNIPLLDWH